MRGGGCVKSPGICRETPCSFQRLKRDACQRPISRRRCSPFGHPGNPSSTIQHGWQNIPPFTCFAVKMFTTVGHTSRAEARHGGVPPLRGVYLLSGRTIGGVIQRWTTWGSRTSRYWVIAECDNPYPCPFDLHLLLAMAQRFESTATVTHDTTKPCRKNGGPSCTYIVKWV